MLVMIETSGCADIGGIEPPAQAHFQHGQIDLGAGEAEQGHGREDLEVGRAEPAAAAPGGLAVHRLDGRPDGGNQVAELPRPAGLGR